MPIATALSRRLGIVHPVLLAPMGFVAGGALAAAATRAGGLGFVGGGYGDPDWIGREMDAAGDVRVGIGFITWSLAERPQLLDAALARHPPAVFLSFGDIRPFAAKVAAAGAVLFAQVQTVAAAREAVAAGADVIVAQGGEAGGHGDARGTMALVPAVKDAVGDVPVVAAGGIADGRGLAAALLLGAEAVLCGTAFYAAEESLAHPAAKAHAARAAGDATVRSRVFDAARGYDWPQPYTLRTLRNPFYERWAADPAAIDEAARAGYAHAAAAGDMDVAGVLVGEAVDMVRGVEPAAAIVARITAEAERLIAAAPRLIAAGE